MRPREPGVDEPGAAPRPTPSVTGGDVVCLGETMAVFVPIEDCPAHQVRSWRRGTGGAESNVACHLAGLGVATRWVSALGADSFGRAVLDDLAARDVRLNDVVLDQTRPTGVYFKEDAAAGQVRYYRSGSAASAMGPELLDRIDLSRTRLLHLSGITPALSESCRELVRAATERRRAGETVSFDVNWRSVLWPSGSDPGVVLADLANASDIVLVGEDEAAAIWGNGDPDTVRRVLPRPTTLVIKHGDAGATLVEGGDIWFEPALQVEVVEPVGAGDAFAAGFLAATLAGEPPRRRLRAGHLQAAATLITRDDMGAALPPGRVNALLEADAAGWSAAVIQRVAE